MHFVEQTYSQIEIFTKVGPKLPNAKQLIDIVKKSGMSIYRTLGKTLLIAGIALAMVTMFDYVVFLANNSGTLNVNPYEYVQYSVIALLIISGIVLIKKTPSDKN